MYRRVIPRSSRRRWRRQGWGLHKRVRRQHCRTTRERRGLLRSMVTGIVRVILSRLLWECWRMQRLIKRLGRLPELRQLGVWRIRRRIVLLVGLVRTRVLRCGRWRKGLWIVASRGLSRRRWMGKLLRIVGGLRGRRRRLVAMLISGHGGRTVRRNVG